MASVPLKREACSRPVSTTVAPSLEGELLKFARKNRVTKAHAVRYIINLFFETNSGLTEVNAVDKRESEVSA